jgi:hypothetical protein
VKSLLLFLLLVAAVGLFFHDRQESAGRERAEALNDQLSQQITTKDATITDLQVKVQQMANAAAQTQGTGSALHPSALQQRPGSWMTIENPLNHTPSHSR